MMFSALIRTGWRAALFFFFLISPLHAAGNLKIEQFFLSNGMEVVVIPNHRVPAVSHMLWFRIGSADDPHGKSGIAHFHEHMMFKGTERYKTGEYAEIIARYGGDQNAFTGHDATSYYVNIAKENLPLVMELEADRIRGLKPSDGDTEKERQVIIEERRQRIENNPQALLSEQMQAALYRHHPYHIPVIGWMHEMEGLTKGDTLDFHAKYCHAGNAILIVSGDITATELKPLVEKYYGNLPGGNVPERRWANEPPHIAARQIVMRHANVKQPEWTRSYATSSFGYGDKKHVLPLFLLSQLMGGGKTSKLYQSIVVEQKLASSIDTSYAGFNLGPSEFEISAIPEKDVSLDALQKAIDAEIAAMLKSGFSDADITRAKTLLKAESIYARDGLTSMARLMGWIRIVGLDADFLTHWEDMVEAITAAQIMEAAKHALNDKASVTGWLLPETAKAEKGKP